MIFDQTRLSVMVRPESNIEVGLKLQNITLNDHYSQDIISTSMITRFKLSGNHKEKWTLVACKKIQIYLPTDESLACLHGVFSVLMEKAQASDIQSLHLLHLHFILLVYMITMLNVCLFFVICVLIAVLCNCIANKHAIIQSNMIKLLRMSLFSLSLLSF